MSLSAVSVGRLLRLLGRRRQDAAEHPAEAEADPRVANPDPATARQWDQWRRRARSATLTAQGRAEQLTDEITCGTTIVEEAQKVGRQTLRAYLVPAPAMPGIGGEIKRLIAEKRATARFGSCVSPIDTMAVRE